MASMVVKPAAIALPIRSLMALAVRRLRRQKRRPPPDCVLIQARQRLRNSQGIIGVGVVAVSMVVLPHLVRLRS